MISLNTIVSEPLGLHKLRSMLPEQSKAMLYNDLRKFASRKSLFRNINSLVVLYETTIDGKKQGHFVVLIPRTHSIEYFSSLGRSPKDEINSMHANPDIFQRLLGNHYTYNRKKLQLNDYRVQDCGYFALARCILSKLKNASFLKVFEPRTLTSSDEVLANMVLLLANR